VSAIVLAGPLFKLELTLRRKNGKKKSQKDEAERKRRKEALCPV